MKRREFLQHTVTAGAAVVAGAVSQPVLAAGAHWLIGCFNRPWTAWSFDDALKQLKDGLGDALIRYRE